MRKLTFADVSSPTFDFDNITYLRQQLAYALNLFFANTGNSDYKGWTISPKLWDKLDQYDPDCPLLTTDLSLPPIMWVVDGEGHLALVNRSFLTEEFENFRFGFNLITLQPEWFNNQNYYFRNLPGQTPFFNDDPPPQMNFSTMFGNQNGWIGAGEYVYGFGNSSLLNGYKTYVDDYTATGDGYNTVFNNTDWAQENPANLTLIDTDNDFDNYLVANILFESVLYAPRPALLTPSRYYVVTSDRLSLTRRRPVSSNLHILSSADTMGVIFPKYLKQQTNGAGGVISHTSINKHPVINVSTQNESIQRVDLAIRDEHDRILSNCNLGAIANPAPLPYTYNVSPPPLSAPPFDSVSNIYWFINLHSTFPNEAKPPANFAAAFNPNPLENANGDYILGPFNAQDQKPMWGVFTDSRSLNYAASATTLPCTASMPPSSYFLHFIRLISG